MALIQSTAIPSGASDYEINQSLKFSEASTEYLSRSASATSDGRKKFTISFWAKLDYLTSGSCAFFRAADAQITLEGGAITTGNKISIFANPNTCRTGAIFTDSSNWYHFVFAIDSTQATAADRAKIYVNGVHSPSENTAYPNQNANVLAASGMQYIGSNFTPGGALMKGYLAEYHFLDTIAATPSDFGETGDYGEWKPIEYSGTYGTNGFYLDFANSSDLGNDVSGNNNDWTPVNLSASNQVIDTPTNNFCVINPLDVQTINKLKEGNLYANSGPARCRGTMAVSSGKWYYEMLMVYQHHGTASCGIRGVNGDKISVDTGNDYVQMNHPYNSGVSINVGGSTTGDLSNGVVSGGSGDSAPGSIIGVMWDMDAETITFKSNNSALASALTDVDFSGISNKETIAPYFVINGGRNCVVNFGQDSSFAGLKTAQGNGEDGDDFYYTPPSGYKSLSNKNLPEPTVVPSEHFNTVLYTGTGNAQSVTNVNFQPDWVWLKRRSGVQNNNVFDAVRGNTKLLATNTTDEEGTVSQFLNSFDSDGFTVGTAGNVSANGETNVAWNWKANGSGSSNTNGSINSTVSANVDAGFSIVSYTGAGSAGTVGHGLSKAPEMYIVKDRDTALTNWWTYHIGNTSQPETDALRLNGTNVTTDDSTLFNDTAPTASVFSVGSYSEVSGNTKKYISYCFHSVDGFSKCSSWVGNANDTGPFVHTGFAPAFVLYKKSAGAAGWFMLDNKRDPDNSRKETLAANTSAAEYTSAEAGTNLQFYANGFRPGGAGGDMNGNNETYIFIAFASMPFKNSHAQ